MSAILPLSFFRRSAVELAPALLGCMIEHEIGREWVGGLIVETEAYTQDDEASHSFRGKTQRNQAMFARAGTVYVYTSYGMHRCMNISSGEEGVGEAVLLRSIWPVKGVELMRQLRQWGPDRSMRELSNGPGKLTVALGIGLEHNGLVLDEAARLRVREGVQVQSSEILLGPRVGISKAVDRPWRFSLRRDTIARCVLELEA